MPHEHLRPADCGQSAENEDGQIGEVGTDNEVGQGRIQCGHDDHGTAGLRAARYVSSSLSTSPMILVAL